MRAAVERQRERRHSAPVDCDGNVDRVDPCRGGHLGEQFHLERMGGEAVTPGLEAARPADSEEACVLARAVVLDRQRPRACVLITARLEIGLRRGSLREERTNGVDLIRVGEVGGTGDRDLAIREIWTSPNEGKRLQRLRGGAEKRQQPWVAGLGDDPPVSHSDGMDRVDRLDDTAAGHFHLDRIGHSRETIPVPELPEVEAWVRELDPLVTRAPIERAGPAHIATVKTFEPALTALAGQTLGGARRRGKNLLFPTADGKLVLRVHLMSAGRLRYHPPGAKTPKTPMFRLSFADGGQLVLTEGGKKKRAGVWLLTPEALEAELAHLGPDALGLEAERLAEILGRERRQLHPLLRDQRALAGIGRAHANEILWLAKLSPFKLSTDLTATEIARLAAAIEDDLVRALALREGGKDDKAVYRIHGHFGEPCPLGHDTLRRVDFEEHTITYCPTCQTGGKELKDRRLSRLLR